jgi:2',3'-cyclic-nucleotide 2'-phosphodiesterase/3'-nucleotidase
MEGFGPSTNQERRKDSLSRRQFIRSCTTAAGMLFFAPQLVPKMAMAAESDKVSVLVTSDLHGNLVGWDYFIAAPANLGLSRVSTLVNKERKKNPNNLLLDDGDILQGTPLDTYYSSVNKDWKIHPMFQAFNAMKYDAIVLGNHEFNFGLDFLRKAIKGSKCPVLSANTVETKSRHCWQAVCPYRIKEFTIGGKVLRLGIIGLTTKAIPNWESPANYAGLSFEDQVKTARHYIEEIKGKADLIILSSHSGVEIKGEETIPGENQVAALAAACPEVSLIIAGHKHVTIDNHDPVVNAEKQVVYAQGIVHGKPVLEPNCWGRFLGKAELEVAFQNGRWQLVGVETSNISTKGVPEDPKIVRIAKPYHEATVAYLNTRIGTAEGDFSADRGTLKDTSLVSLVNEVQRYFSQAQLSAAASFNGKAAIKQGPIKLQNIYALYIYENYLYAIRITGDQLRRYLEYAARFYKRLEPGDTTVCTNNKGIPDYNYDMVQGVEYHIDPRQPEGQRIRKLSFGGKEVAAQDSFTMAINNYRFNGGGGYMAAMGFDKRHRPEVVYDSQKRLGDSGQIRSLIIDYVRSRKVLQPVVYNNWQLDTGV